MYAASSCQLISLTNIACKFLERTIVYNLTHHIESSNLLMSNQLGFRYSKSSVTHLQECVSHIINLLNSGKSCDFIVFDFHRASDKVDLSILCHKLKNSGVDGCYIEWIINYLSTRKHFVSYNTTQSATAMVTPVLIQENFLNSTLFPIFINDLCQCMNFLSSPMIS